MNSNYINEYINLFERVLSAAYISKFSLEALAKNISNSDYFQKIERDLKESSPITSDYVLVKSILTDINIALEDVPIFNQCLWAAESYLRIQGETKLTFETIFLYIPIKKMYELFDVYHEMAFSQIVEHFKKLFLNKSVLAMLIDTYKISIKYISEITDVSYNTLLSLKSRRRNIKKSNAVDILQIASVFNVRPETLCEIEI